MNRIALSTTLATVLAVAFTLSPVARESTDPDHIHSWIDDHTGTEWNGGSELWIDPMGNDADVSNATLSVRANSIMYTWVYRGVEQTGELRWSDGVLHWRDSWHQPERVALDPVAGYGGLVTAGYSYAAGTGPDWHWRIKLSQRPDGTLVLQMSNIAPWGEEARAVRTVVRRTE